LKNNSEWTKAASDCSFFAGIIVKNFFNIIIKLAKNKNAKPKIKNMEE